MNKIQRNLLALLRKFLSNKSNYKFLSFIEFYLFPALCIICDKPRETGSKWFCSSCTNLLSKNSSERKSCPRCGQNPLLRKCSCAYAWDYPFEKIFSIFDYDETVQEIVRNIKYRGKKSLASELYSFAPFNNELISSFDLLVPIPLHWTRYQKRGYNQAEWFAKGASAKTNIPFIPNIVKRIRTTGTQTKLNRIERQKNMKNAFRINESYLDYIKEKRILLIDDVVTTGSTTTACSNVLLQNGCKSVAVLSIARD